MARRKGSRSLLGLKSPKSRKSILQAKTQSPLGEMKKYFVQLKRMVPTIEEHQKINQLELLQHVINYIQDLEVTLDHPPAILKSVSPCRDSPDSGHVIHSV
ncbi:unnamed protein product [Calicophoron daubneyi]|uniref:BHLH domain-containing protein n=1 Tax=Calicophoron daubneyi TaxID=300641 RepID=A0AAV2TJH8_CALDB